MLINPFLNLEGLLFHMHLKGLYLSILMYSFGGFLFYHCVLYGKCRMKTIYNRTVCWYWCSFSPSSETFFYYCVLVAF